MEFSWSLRNFILFFATFTGLTDVTQGSHHHHHHHHQYEEQPRTTTRRHSNLRWNRRTLRNRENIIDEMPWYDIRLIRNLLIAGLLVSITCSAEAATQSVILSTPEECARTCVLGEPPKTCYYHWKAEMYSTLTRACTLCRTNTTMRLADDCQCIEADGVELSGIMVVNRMYPGPAIVVCLGDKVVVDFENTVHGNDLTIHWHGLFQKNYQYYDGVPFVTQCPILVGTTFRYQFGADNAGTHFWHSHTALTKADGLEGALIVREPKITEPNSHLWDRDLLKHTIFLTDWFHDSANDHFPGNRVRKPGQSADSFLINGKGQWRDPATNISTTVPLAVFNVQRGLRYRFRLINSCALTCAATMSIQGHRLTVIATDGEFVEPADIDSINSASAERYDFVLNANATGNLYWIQVRGLGQCAGRQLQQLALIRYNDAPFNLAALPRPTYLAGIPTGVVLNPLNVRCHDGYSPPGVLCVSELKHARPVNPRILQKKADIQVYLGFGFRDYNISDLFKPGTYQKYLVGGGTETAALVANISNVFPPSNLLTQRNEMNPDDTCHTGKLPSYCSKEETCHCTHVQPIPRGALTEFILVDEAQIPGLSHPFHLHGAAFHIMGEGCASDYNITSIDVDTVKDWDAHGLMDRYFGRPPSKDTYSVPNNGYTIVRFIADNPGYWLFHCHFLFHLEAGMALVLHIGDEDDLPPAPPNFPTCGNYVPPINFPDY